MKQIAIYLLLITAIFLAPPQANAQRLNLSQLETNIDALVSERIGDETPGLVVGIVRNGEVLFSKGYGQANLSYGIPNDPSMVYNVGSVAKQFLGYAFAMMHVRGELNIDDPVGKYLEDWPEFDEPVTLRHLLTHTSGYREAYAISELAGRLIEVDHLTQEECLEVVRRQPELEFTPGSRYTYNSTAWVILAEVFARVAGEPADTWVEANILAPLGMTASHIESYVGEVVPNAAESYSIRGDGQYLNVKSNRAIFGAADVFTNIPDLAKWVNNYKTGEIGGKAVTDVFLDPFILNDGINSDYALGIRNHADRGLRIISHTGGHAAFSTQVSYYPESDLGIIILDNFGGRGAVSAGKIAEWILGEQMTTDTPVMETFKTDTKQLKQLTGLYLGSDQNKTLNLTIKDDHLTVNGQTKLIPTAKNQFQVDGRDTRYEIDLLPDGSRRMTIISSNSKNVYHQVKPWSAKEKELAEFTGDYWSDELETVYHLSVENDELTVRHRWLGELTLNSVTADVFRSNAGHFVQFVRDAKGKLTGLNVNYGRTLRVYFQRRS